jgi:hypothetical protein
MLRMGAPLVAAGTVWVAGRALRAGYAAATGAPPPKPDDLDAPVMRIVLFAVATATVTAIINVAVQRGVAKAIAKQEAIEPV